MLSVIIPVYNERRTIREIVRRVTATDIPKQIIIVDDCSTDGTRAILAEMEKNIPAAPEGIAPVRYVFIYKERNCGKGAAIRDGIALAEEGLTIIQDADLEYDPSDYRRLMSPILTGRADVVYGSRFTGSDRRVLYFWHSVANHFLTLVSNILTNLNLTDMETGYKVFRTSLLQGIPLRSDRFGFEPEVTAKVAKLGCRIFEVPISYSGRTYAQGKKIGIMDAVSALFVMVKYWLVDDLHTAATAGVRTLHIMQGAGRYNEWLFRMVEPYLGVRIMEMGSGVGNITGFLIDREFIAATDVSEAHCRELSREFSGYPNIKVLKVDFNDPEMPKRALGEEKIDTVLSMNVLEHIERDSSALEGCVEALPDGGRLVIIVPAMRSLFCDMDRQIGHHRRYDMRELEMLLESAGLTPVHWRYFNMLGALGWFVNGRIFGRKLLPSRQLRFFDLFMAFVGLERHFNPPFGLGLLMVAEKKR